MKNQKDISKWLLVILFFIFLIVIIGGITRLTQSGLSIVEWNVVTGVLPPLDEAEWLSEFNKYKESPEYIINNSEINISSFKIIYFWEYLHRLLARILGFIALAPLIYFIFTKKITPDQRNRFLIIPILIGIQGLIGWLMVKSGLSMKTYNGIGVSHYWLALHLLLALSTYCVVVWNYLRINNSSLQSVDFKGLKYGIAIFTMLFIQIIFGALLAGLDGGSITNKFPDINGEFYPSKALFDLSNPYFVHFIHRWLPFIIAFIVAFIFYKIKKTLSRVQKSLFGLFLGLFIIQMILGILTVLTSVNIMMAIMHQVNAVFMLTISLIILFSLSSK